PPSDRSTVCYMWRDPVSGWSSCASFGDTGAQAHHVSMASDPGGAIHVAYWDSYNSKIELASRDSVGTWTIEPVQADSMNGAGGSRWLVIDAAGTVHLAYADATGLVYAQRNAGVWAKEPVDPTPKLG
ncbi:MAG: hypothetical protein JWO36_1773, partial [Myxococcales bacterium]|nr:hypothetical protein [Myxococcales bacterium]